jgi:hypothetical protein
MDRIGRRLALNALRSWAMDQLRRCLMIAVGLGVVLTGVFRAGGAADKDPETQRQIQELREQNDSLQKQLRRQQELIEELGRKVSSLRPGTPAEETEPRAGAANEQGLGKLHLSGEASVGLFHSGSRGQYPNTEFQIDEAKLFVEAPIWREIYFFTELNLVTREGSEGDLYVYSGELYLDAENLSRFWGQAGQLNMRIGRIDIPFGEEYLSRDAIDNPLVSHSIMDLWGVDEGVELYGSVAGIGYVLAVQNGGHEGLRDFNSDKAIVGKVYADPTRWLHLSLSAMRTGRLDVTNDQLSELWLGSGLVRPLGGPGTTEFQANVFQGDVQLKFRRTTLKAAGGTLIYRDNDPNADSTRRVYYYSVEAQQDIYRGLYGATRWSQAFANRGFPIVGNGDVGTFGFGPILTRDLWKLSLGLGYRWSRQFVLKAEYSLEGGRTLGGSRRDHENLVATVLTGSF